MRLAAGNYPDFLAPGMSGICGSCSEQAHLFSLKTA
jgi:hypothetical protein